MDVARIQKVSHPAWNPTKPPKPCARRGTAPPPRGSGWPPRRGRARWAGCPRAASSIGQRAPGAGERGEDGRHPEDRAADDAVDHEGGEVPAPDRPNEPRLAHGAGSYMRTITSPPAAVDGAVSPGWARRHMQGCSPRVCARRLRQIYVGRGSGLLHFVRGGSATACARQRQHRAPRDGTCPAASAGSMVEERGCGQADLAQGAGGHDVERAPVAAVDHPGGDRHRRTREQPRRRPGAAGARAAPAGLLHEPRTRATPSSPARRPQAAPR